MAIQQLLFSISTPSPLVGFLVVLPAILVVAGWTMKIVFRRKETVAFGYNGNSWMKWVFMLWVLIVILNEWIAPAIQSSDIPSELKLVNHFGANDQGINFIFHGFTLYCFLCYFFVSFRELNAEQAERAKGAKGLVVSIVNAAGVTAATTGQGIMGLLSLVWTMIMAAAYPIISVTTTTITYVSASAAMFFVGIIPLIFIVVILAVLGMIVQMIVLLLIFFIPYLSCVIRFLVNTLITMRGPSAVWYNVKKDDDD